MPEPLPPEAIYAAARQAGFSPDQAVTMTAIALAESGGNPGAHNPNGEDSRGLWQINMSPQANGNAPWAQRARPLRPARQRQSGVGGVAARRRHRTVDGDPRRSRQPLPRVPGRGDGRRAGQRRDRRRQLPAAGQLRLARRPGWHRRGGPATAAAAAGAGARRRRPAERTRRHQPLPRGRPRPERRPVRDERRRRSERPRPRRVRLLRARRVGGRPGRRRRRARRRTCSTST